MDCSVEVGHFPWLIWNGPGGPWRAPGALRFPQEGQELSTAATKHCVDCLRTAALSAGAPAGFSPVAARSITLQGASLRPRPLTTFSTAAERMRSTMLELF